MSLLLKDVLAMAEARFKKESIVTARLDAEMLFSFVANKDKAWQFLNYGKTIDEGLCEEYFRFVDERGDGKPLQYIIGSQEFMGLTFLVNDKVLIPRQDTELLVEKALEIIEKIKKRRAIRILDLCCGSGAISISIAHNLKKTDQRANIIASDISIDALDVARKNAKLHNVEKSIRFVEGDLFKSFPKNRRGKGKKTFDLIISNPPYIPTEEIASLMREVRDHEPRQALDGGLDGLDFYRDIMKEADLYLVKDGLLMLEIGYNQGPALLEIGRRTRAYDEGSILKDYGNKDRLVIFSLKSEQGKVKRK